MLFEKGVIDPKAAHYSYRCSALFLQVLLLLLTAMLDPLSLLSGGVLAMCREIRPVFCFLSFFDDELGRERTQGYKASDSVLVLRKQIYFRDARWF